MKYRPFPLVAPFRQILPEFATSKWQKLQRCLLEPSADKSAIR